MNREETIKVIQDYTDFFNKAKEQGRTVTVFDYVDSKEMNKDKAIGLLQSQLKGWDAYYYKSPEMSKALQFAIDYMKESQDEGDIIGWVNYYDGGDNGLNTISDIYTTKELAYQCRNSNYNCIQIPIRKPK